MAGSAAHRRSVMVLGLVAVLVGAAAAIVGALHVNTGWAVALGIAAIVVGASAGIVDKFVVPQADARQQAQGEDERAHAVGLTIMRDDTQVTLSVTNQHRFEISSVSVGCWPDAAPDAPASQLPPFVAATSSEVSWNSIAGGGQRDTVANLPPSPEPGSGTGPVVGAWHRPPLSTPAVFEVDWLDHQRMSRRLVGRADLSDPLPITIVELSPPQPIMRPPGWRNRIRR